MNLLDLFFPRKCPYCLKLINRGELECAECRSEFPKEPYIRTLPSGNKCVSAFMYDSKVREALTRYKFIIADIVTSVPLSKKRLRVRGYNQSELIARELAKILELDYAETLIKCCDNLEQHTLNHDVRAENIIGVYKVIDKINLQGKKILLIDDIVTTGYTLSECCRVLSESENINITCATLATAL